MAAELSLLTWVSSLFTALMWMPYVAARISRCGLWNTLAYGADDGLLPSWAFRAKAAHHNAIENLVPFAAFVLIAHVTGAATATTATLSTVYLFARIFHYLVYTAGLPVLRTLSFVIGWLATLAIFAQIVMI